MLNYRRIVQTSARHIAAAANRTVDDLVAHRVEHEPEFTSEMLGRMKESMNGYRVGGVHWTAKTLTSHGANAQERRFGADFLGVLDLDLPEYKVRKGFLAQAKRIDGWSGMNGEDWDRIVDQCKTMLSITPESFVFVYSPRAITVIPAIAIISAQQRSNLSDFYSRRLVRSTKIISSALSETCDSTQPTSRYWSSLRQEMHSYYAPQLMKPRPNHALQRTARSRHRCKPGALSSPSMSLGR
jgi:hypothetical protein